MSPNIVSLNICCWKMCLNMSAMLLCCVLKLISCLKSWLGCHTVLSQVSLQETKEVNLNDLNCTGCRGPLISMLFLPCVNFDYGEMQVMALLSFLSFSRSFWLQGVGGVEELIGTCRAHCLQIHGFLDWPASGSETHQLLQTHKRTHPTHTQTLMPTWYVSLSLIHAQKLSQANQHFQVIVFMFRMWIFIKCATQLTAEVTIRLVWEDMMHCHLWLTKK